VRRHAAIEDVHDALDALIQRQQVRLVRDEYDPATDNWHPGEQWETHTIPSLWEQLTAASAWKAQGVVTGSSFGSRPVISAGIVAKRAEIEHWAVRGGDEHANPSPGQKYALAQIDAAKARHAAGEAYMAWRSVDAAEPAEPDWDTADPATADAYWRVANWWAADLAAAGAEFDAADQAAVAAEDRAQAKAATLTPDSLRAVAANITDQTDIDWWHETIGHWVNDIRTALALTPEYPSSIRGQPCPDPTCGATTATLIQDGEPVRVAALSIVWTATETGQDQQVRAIQCRSCGHATFRGAELNDLALRWMTEPERAHDPIAVHAGSNMAPGVDRPDELPDTCLKRTHKRSLGRSNMLFSPLSGSARP
jgi:hypothetical protein